VTVNLQNNEQLPEDAHADPSDLTLTCHIGFFNPLPANVELSERLNAINGILKSIHEDYGTSTVPPADLGVRNPVSVVNMAWRSIPVRLRFVLHTEIVSLAIYLHVGLVPSNGQDHIASIITGYFPNIDPTVTTAFVRCSCAELRMRRRFLYVTVWNLFFRERKKIPSSEKWQFPELLQNTTIIGNFRGLIIRAPPFTSVVDSLSRSIANKCMVTLLKPFLCCGPNITMDDHAICEMKNCRALYVSKILYTI
jgi:hypothetical protein